MREDYSTDGDVWDSFSFDEARSRVYRWGEDGLLGLSDRFGRLCFGLALWNGQDPILKERFFGLSGPQGNHGEDVKELYYYLDATPTHSYAKALYKYPQAEFPYAKLIAENACRSHEEPEYELTDTGVFDQNRYFDVQIEYAKESITDILIRITIHNRGSEAARLVVLPSLWFRNTWSWGAISEECLNEPEISISAPDVITASHTEMGVYEMAFDAASNGAVPHFLFTNNETNTQRLYGETSPHRYTKDAFHDAVIHGAEDAVNPEQKGTKAAGLYDLMIPASDSVELCLRLTAKGTWPGNPYYCSWDLAFHTAAFTRIDPFFDKDQLILLLREWYTHPNGQIPAYEWNFSDVNPPVHVWAALRLYREEREQGRTDDAFLEKVFQKLLINFTWWVNRKDSDGNNLFEGGFLGFDNISVFDRSRPLPTGGKLKQADGTSWMAFYCLNMLQMALTLAENNPVYEDMGTKFIAHFTRIVSAMNDFCGEGLWDEKDGFYYDMLELEDRHVPLKIRSIEGFIPLLATCYTTGEQRRKSPGFTSRLLWYVKNRPQVSSHLLEINGDVSDPAIDHLLTVTPRNRLERILRYLFDEEEFLSPYGIRSVSKYHENHPYTYTVNGTVYSVDYEPGEGTTAMFGGNSNWRGPVWLPINYMIIQALRTYDHFYGEKLLVEFPTGSGNKVTLGEAARLLALRVSALFLPDGRGNRPCHGGEARYADDSQWNDLVLFYEYFHGDSGKGLGASHQTGWTALVAELLAKEV